MKVQDHAADTRHDHGDAERVAQNIRLLPSAPGRSEERDRASAADGPRLSGLINPNPPHPVMGYVFAVLAVAIGAAVAAAVHHTANDSLLLLLLAVVATTWFGGLRPALVACALSIVVAVFFLFDPIYSVSIDQTGDVIGLLVFLFVAPLFAYVYSRTRDALTTIDRLNTNLALLYHDERLARDRAESAMDRLHQVEAITDVALSHLDLDALLDELLGRLRVALHSDSATLLLVDEEQHALRLRASSGARREPREDISIPLGSGFAGRIATTMKPFIANDIASLENVAPFVRADAASAMGVPLSRAAQLVGVLYAATTSIHEFSEADLAVLELVAERISGAIDRAQIYERSQKITEDLRQANEIKDVAISRHHLVEDQLTSLVEASGGLIESLRLHEMLPAILQLSRRLIAADAHALWSFDQAQNQWAVLSSAGLSDAYLRDASIAVTGMTPQPREMMVITDVDSEPALEGRRAGYPREGIKSLLVLPLKIAGSPHGTLTFYFHERHEFSALELRIGTALANLASAAITTSRLQDEQRRSSVEIERANLKLRFLAEASAILAESLDYETTLESVARLAVPQIADWCSVNLLDEDREMRTLAVAHIEPEKVALARELEPRYPTDPDAPHGWPEVLRTRRSELIEHISDEMLEAGTVDEEHLRIIKELGLTSSLCVPLIARGPVLGTITLITAGNTRTLTTDDVVLAEELARRAAVAIDNAQLFRTTQQTAADLRRANEAKDEFLGLVSHELRTPITTIMGNAEVLEKRANQIDAESRAEALADISAESQRLHRLIENLLVLARLEQGRSVEMEPLLIQRHVDKIVEMQQRRTPDANIRVAMDAATPPVCADATYFEQVLQNLLSNAYKYSPAGSQIDLSVTFEGDELCITVSDRGGGIDPQDLPHIFEPFYRSRRTEALATGAGIGLAVCKRLVEVQRGRIWAASREGGGTVMSFTLPLADSLE